MAQRLVLARRLGAAALVAAGGGALAACSKEEEALAQLQRQADKARRRAQERVKVDGSSGEMLGMTPKLWLEALDEEHRYGSSCTRTGSDGRRRARAGDFVTGWTEGVAASSTCQRALAGSSKRQKQST